MFHIAKIYVGERLHRSLVFLVLFFASVCVSAQPITDMSLEDLDIQLLSSASWDYDNEHLVLFDSLKQRMTFLHPEQGVLTTQKGEWRGNSMFSKVDSLVKISMTKEDSQLLPERVDWLRKDMSSAGGFSLALGESSKNASDEIRYQVKTIHDFSPLSDGLFALGRLQIEGARQNAPGFFTIPAHFSGSNAVRPILPTNIGQNLILYDIFPFIAGDATKAFFLTFKNGMPRLNLYSNESSPELLEAIPGVEWDRIPEFDTYQPYPELLKDIAGAKMPIGMFLREDTLYVVLQDPNRQPVWSVQKIWLDYKDGNLIAIPAGEVGLPVDEGEHISIVPADSHWYVISKKAMDAQFNQGLTNLTKIPKDWVENPLASPLTFSNGSGNIAGGGMRMNGQLLH